MLGLWSAGGIAFSASDDVIRIACFEPDAAVTVVCGFIGRIVAQQVLPTQFRGNLLARKVNSIHSFRMSLFNEVTAPASDYSQFIEHVHVHVILSRVDPATTIPVSAKEATQ